MTKRPLYVLGIGLAALAGFSACRVAAPGAAPPPVTGATGSPSTSPAGPSAGPSAEPSASAAPSTSPAGPVATPGCRDANVRVTVSTSEGAAGTMVQRFVLT